jgi:hypothetical protein
MRSRADLISRRAKRGGVLVHVGKPVDASELIATVANVAGTVRRRERYWRVLARPRA